MSTTKSALKSIAAAIQAARYDEVIQEARQLVSKEAGNYQANLFLGFALDKQNKLADAEHAYEAATKIRPEDPQAWQGLIKLFEKQNGDKIDRYQAVAVQLALIYGDLDDKYRCQDVVDKFIAFVKSHGNRRQQRSSLDILLPSSPLYPLLEGRIPHPALTFEKIAQITEVEEKERMNKEIGERRTRLGARVNVVTTEVKHEVFRDSPLELLYERIIEWSQDDDLRRIYEEKLLQRCYDGVVVAPQEVKQALRPKVEKLAKDMVIIKHPFQLAWDVAVGWQDATAIENLDVALLREYCSFFPTKGLSRVLQGFMVSEISPFPPPPAAEPPDVGTKAQQSDNDSEDEDVQGGVSLGGLSTAEDRLILMSDGLADASSSILAHRIMSEYFSYLQEYESVAEITRAGLVLATSEAQKLGISFRNSSQSLTAMLGTALVFYQSPKNHPEAKALFEEILETDATSTSALIGIGLIYEEEEDFPSAINFLDRALLKDGSNIRIKAESAWVKAMNGDYQQSRENLEDCLGLMDTSDLRTRELRGQTQYRIGVCIWNADTSFKARKSRDGAYAYFLAALKSNLSYAPAYTSLGVFYSDYSKDKKRARKCFQKAFELSAGEIEAAKRLADGFADQGDWDLVEVVAQRVIASGRVKPSPGSKKKGSSWPYTALGIAELNKQDHSRSIVAFQSALRITPEDYHSWVGLAESYHNSGRYVAATKAFAHAERFEPSDPGETTSDFWFAKYMLGNVKREMGEYDESIASYEMVLKIQPEESGVILALIQTLVESAWTSIDRGLFGQAVSQASEAISYGGVLIKSRPDAFNLWKALGDACSVFSWAQSEVARFPHDTVMDMLKSGEHQIAYSTFTEIDTTDLSSLSNNRSSANGANQVSAVVQCLQATLLCHKRALHASASDIHAQAVAYYNLGWAENRAHVCLHPQLSKKSTKYQKAAVRCFKRAIELEPGNAEFWNALGIVTSSVAPSIAQHAFVRSLYLNERSAYTWTNLGTLYLLQNDVQLANEAFTRAQSSDPEYGHAWIGQGFLALLYGDPKEARLLFTHALEISETMSRVTKQQYCTALFDHIRTTTASSSLVDLIQPIFALNQLKIMAPDDLPYQHLAGLFLERVLETSAALAILATVCEQIEADYEVTESPVSLSRFALAKSDLGRIRLVEGSYDDAVESAETALELSAEDAGNELSSDARQQCRLSAHLTLALANHYNNDSSQAVKYIEQAVVEAQDDPSCLCLLAQILWATGTSDARIRARDELFRSVEMHPGHVESVLLLGTMALLDGDADTIEAVESDLHSLRTSTSVSDEEQAMVAELLRGIAALCHDYPEAAVLAETQSNIMIFPNQAQGWSRLADLGGDAYAADMALRTATKTVPPLGDLGAMDLSEAFAGTGKVTDSQCATVLAPWNTVAWEALSESVV